MASDGGISTAISLAVVILLIVVLCWLRLRSKDVAGFWASPAGSLYEIRPTGSRTFSLRASAGGGGGPLHDTGRITSLRTVILSGGRRGQVELGGRRISWARDGIWARQGI
jgi:hypothetical protein